MLVQVGLGLVFAKRLKNYPKEDRMKILSFMHHVQNNGFDGLEGRNKASDDVDKNDPKYITKVRYARKHVLWHYHIGIECYDMTYPFGERTSKYVLHYSRKEIDDIKIADMDEHPPFVLPAEDYLV